MLREKLGYTSLPRPLGHLNKLAASSDLVETVGVCSTGIAAAITSVDVLANAPVEDVGLLATAEDVITCLLYTSDAADE